MKALYEAYHDKAVILVVYIREAHPASADQTAESAGWKVIDKTVFYQPKSYDQRRKLAETACSFWELPIPTLVDTMEPSVGVTYDAWPNRLYLIDAQGKLVYRGVRGPAGVNVHEGELELRKLLGITSGEPVTKPKRIAAPSGRGRFGGGDGAAERPDDAKPSPKTPPQPPDPPQDRPQ
jgi:hypothetical protein